MNNAIKLTILSMLFLPFFALAAPGIPEQFYGSVSGSSNGAVVQAKVGGTVVGSTVVANGSYGYSPNLMLVLDSNDGSATDIAPGAVISFFIGGVDTGTTALFSNGGYTLLNLAVPSSSSGGGTVGSGGGGGGGSSSSDSGKKSEGDANSDGKIDILDFNALMANWGKTGTNVSDFNSDGKVDILDFNIMMINWGK